LITLQADDAATVRDPTHRRHICQQSPRSRSPRNAG
jgi:hypothetical protein